MEETEPEVRGHRGVQAGGQKPDAPKWSITRSAAERREEVPGEAQPGGRAAEGRAQGGAAVHREGWRGTGRGGHAQGGAAGHREGRRGTGNGGAKPCFRVGRGSQN